MDRMEPDDDTFVSPSRVIVPEPDDPDADTVIRARPPFADVPAEAFAELRHERFLAPQSEDRTAPPPSYGFSVNRTAPIGLDAPALLGRRPALPRIVGERPQRLVRVPSPLHEVSATHLELRQQGALVIVTDLRSTNGSVVRIPGRDAVKLRQGESVVVAPGTVIDIGDGNLVEILPRVPGGSEQSTSERPES